MQNNITRLVILRLMTQVVQVLGHLVTGVVEALMVEVHQVVGKERKLYV